MKTKKTKKPTYYEKMKQELIDLRSKNKTLIEESEARAGIMLDLRKKISHLEDKIAKTDGFLKELNEPRFTLIELINLSGIGQRGEK